MTTRGINPPPVNETISDLVDGRRVKWDLTPNHDNNVELFEFDILGTNQFAQITRRRNGEAQIVLAENKSREEIGNVLRDYSLLASIARDPHVKDGTKYKHIPDQLREMGEQLSPPDGPNKPKPMFGGVGPDGQVFRC